MFENDTITLFNSHLDEAEGVDIWERTLIPKCQLVVSKGRNKTMSGLKDSDTAKVYVSIDTLKSLDKDFLPPQEYMKVDDFSKVFTFNALKDFFVEGNVLDADLPTYAVYEYMRENYPNVYMITDVDIFKDVLPHFEIGGV